MARSNADSNMSVDVGLYLGAMGGTFIRLHIWCFTKHSDRLGLFEKHYACAATLPSLSSPMKCTTPSCQMCVLPDLCQDGILVQIYLHI